MTISGSGFNTNLSPTPTIFEREVAAQVDLQKQAEIGRGNVLIVPQSQQDMIPFTKMGERTTWNYKSESGHPSLLPMGTLRGAGPEFATHDEGWQTNYDALYDQLPADLKAMLAKDPTLAATLEAVLEIAARALQWQADAGKYIDSENALNRVIANMQFAQAAFGSSYLALKELFELADEYLEAVGPNYPYYTELKDFIGQAEGIHHEAMP